MFLLGAICLGAQESHKLLRAGDRNYKDQDFAAAEESYRKSLQKDKTTKGNFNLGNSIYNQDRHEESAEYYENAANLAKDNNERADAYYNLGNAQFRNEQFKESIEAYKQALRYNPQDVDARKNLFLAKMIKQQQQQDQQQQQQDNNQEENDQQNEEQQQQDQQQDQQQENQEQQQNQNQQDQENPSEESQQDQQQKLSKEDAERLLQIIENEEKKVQERLKKVSGKRTKPEKDW